MLPKIILVIHVVLNYKKSIETSIHFSNTIYAYRYMLA